MGLQGSTITYPTIGKYQDETIALLRREDDALNLKSGYLITKNQTVGKFSECHL